MHSNEAVVWKFCIPTPDCYSKIYVVCYLVKKTNIIWFYFWFMVNEEKNAVRGDGTMVLTIQC